MSTTDQTKPEPWHLRFGRAKFLSPWLFVIIVGVYAFMFLIVAALMYVLGWIVPHLPWIPKPYVSPDPAPLVTAFYCANMAGGFMVIAVPLIYIVGPRRQIRPLRPKKDGHETKT